MQFDFEIGGCQVAGVDVDRDVDVGLRGLRRQRLRRVGILEAQILEILSENAHRRLRAGLRRWRFELDLGCLRAGCLGVGGGSRGRSLGDRFARRWFCRFHHLECLIMGERHGPLDRASG
jgi:hypothetical protein